MRNTRINNISAYRCGRARVCDCVTTHFTIHTRPKANDMVATSLLALLRDCHLNVTGTQHLLHSLTR